MTAEEVRSDAPASGSGIASLILEPVPESSWRARKFVRAVLDDRRWDSIRDTALLLTSELVTNALIHTASTAELVVTLDEEVTVAVTDASTGPLLTSAPSGGVNDAGRGIFLVDQLSHRWGTEHAHGRKTVWFSLLPDGGQAVTVAEVAPRSDAPTLSPPARSADRRLAFLLLDRPLEAHLTSRQRIAEILARTSTALDATGALLDLDQSLGGPISLGTLEGIAHRETLRLAGRSYGSLTLFGTVPFGDEEQAFFHLATQWLALNVASGRLSSTVGRRQADLEFMGEATELLAGAVHVDHVLSVLVQLAVAGLAEWAAAFVVDMHGRPRRVTALHADEGRLDQLVAVLDGDRALAAALTESVSHGDPRPLPGGIFLADQHYQALAVPLASRQGPPSLLVLGARTSPDNNAYLATVELSRRASLALDKATLYEQVTEAARALQDSLRPAQLPALPTLDLAVRHRAATPAIAVGGDFWDVFQLDDGTAVLSVGDVCGKGPSAAAIARTSREVLRLLLEDGRPVTDALARLNRTLLAQTDDERFCTMAVATARSDGDGCRLHVTLAGHPRPIVARSSGVAELVGHPGSLLGVLPAGDFKVQETELHLGPADRLVLYTDGVTEARRASEVFGEDALTEVAARSCSLDPQAIADAVYDAASSFSGHDLHDDLAVLVARCTPVPAGEGASRAPRP